MIPLLLCMYPIIVVISIGGSVTALTRNAEKFITYAEAIREIVKGNTAQIVTGREYRATT